MEQFFGFLIFLLLAAFSVASKVREQRKEEEQRAQRQREKKQEHLDLPEATRRTLYGDPDMPTARPRRGPAEWEGGEGQPPVAFPMREVREEPRPTRPVAAEAPDARHVPAERSRRIPGGSPHGPAPVSPRRPTTLEEMFREMQRRVEEQMGKPPEAPAPQPPPRQPKQPKRTAPVTYEQARKRQQAERAKAMERQHRPRPESPRHAPRPGAPAAAARSVVPAEADRARARKQRERHAPVLFQNLDDVRRGIILSEILGTPRSLQQWP